jgi:hypothetical protein
MKFKRCGSCQPKDVHEKIISARYEFKVLAEFTDACKAAAIAISSGLINPINDLEPQPIAVLSDTLSSLPIECYLQLQSIEYLQLQRNFLIPKL